MNPNQVAAISEKEKATGALPNLGGFQSAHITAAENGGYHMETMHAPKSPMAPFQKPHVTVHAGRKELLAHLDKVLSKHEGKRVKASPAPAGMNLIRPAKFASTY